MSEIASPSLRRLEVSPHQHALRAATLLLLLLGACASEDRYGDVVRVNNDNDPATDPDSGRCPAFDSRYREKFKACEVDADCERVAFRARCSSVRVYGIAKAELDAFYECAPTTDDCDEPPSSGVAEDGRDLADFADFTDVDTVCFEGRCEARVASRVCGSDGRVCGENELCVGMLNRAGQNEYHCVDNTCEGERLDCSCAAPICQQFTDQLRVCAIDQIEDADVYCKAELR